MTTCVGSVYVTSDIINGYVAKISAISYNASLTKIDLKGIKELKVDPNSNF